MDSKTDYDPKRVFIIYGRNTMARDALARFLSSLGLVPWEFDELVNEMARQSAGSPFIGDVVASGMKRSKAIIALFTPDEFSRLRPDYRKLGEPDAERWQPRQNVLFEAGMALAHDAARTLLVTLGNVGLFSDIHGRHVVELDNSESKRRALRGRLIALGCAVDEAAVDWQTPEKGGDFEQSLPRADGAPFYDELSALERELGARRIEGVPLLDIVKDAVGRRARKDWGGKNLRTAPRELMEVVEKKFSEEAEEAYWWLVVLGVFRFKEIEYWWDRENWRGSVDYVMLTDRGVALLSELARRKQQ
jgi:predicted nucleotide-binding protein